LRTVEILGTENAKGRTSKSTSSIGEDGYLSAETVGVTSQKRTMNGEKKRLHGQTTEIFNFAVLAFS